MDETANLAEEMMGGSSAPGKEAQEAAEGGGETQAAAWTKQLPKELRENGEAFKKIGGFKTVGDLAQAFVDAANKALDVNNPKAVFEAMGAPKEGEPYGIEEQLKGGLENFIKYAKEASLTKAQAGTMMEGYKALMGEMEAAQREAANKALPEITRGLVDEFGADAVEYYRKGAARSGLKEAIARSGLYGNKDIARAIVLLGRETSEDFTPQGKRGQETKPKSIKEGATFSYS
jgi:hypothetical protein